jgi:hypothetical protein
VSAISDWMRLSAREKAKAIAAYKKLPLAVDEETARLGAENADLRRRVRLAREELLRPEPDASMAEQLLDLRKPLPQRKR